MNENGIPCEPSPEDPGFLDPFEAFLDAWAEPPPGPEEPDPSREAILREICDTIAIIVEEIIARAGEYGEPSAKNHEPDKM